MLRRAGCPLLQAGLRGPIVILRNKTPLENALQRGIASAGFPGSLRVDARGERTAVVRSRRFSSQGSGLGREEWEWASHLEEQRNLRRSRQGGEAGQGARDGQDDGSEGMPAWADAIDLVDIEDEQGSIESVVDPSQLADGVEKSLRDADRVPPGEVEDGDDAHVGQVRRDDVQEPPPGVDPREWNDPLDSIPPERIGSARSARSTREDQEFYHRMSKDKGDAIYAGFEPEDSEGWPDEEKVPRQMPLWMFYEAARSELESEMELDDVQRSKSKIEQTVVRYPMRDDQGQARAVGRRKTAAAQVAVRLGDGEFRVNGKHLAEYFFHEEDRVQSMVPLLALRACGAFDVKVHVKGGGTSGQAGAVKNGLARALARYDPYLRPQLKKLKLLNRDPRMVERKKPGLKKARRRFQWVKR